MARKSRRSRRNFDFEYDDVYEQEQMTTTQVLLSYTRNPLFFAGMLLFAAFVLFTDGSLVMTYLWGSPGERYEGRLPNSLLTLNYPYTMMRGVVGEQPVQETDVPIFWHPHRSDERILKKVLNNCYGVEIVELDSKESIQKAKEVKLASRNTGDSRFARFAILSPYFPEVMEVLTVDHLGRGVCFFRHPLDYDFHGAHADFTKKDGGDWDNDNQLIRYLINKKAGDLTFKDLGDAKQILRDVCVVSVMDKTTESIERAAAYLGWSTIEGVQSSCVEDIVSPLNPTERFVDHETHEWDKFYRENRYDCQLFEFAQQAWRAQEQTIIPLARQQQREERLRGTDDEVE